MYNNFTAINNFVAAQVLGVKSGSMDRDPIYKDFISVNGCNRHMPISEYLVFMEGKSTYDKNLLEYVDNIIICNDLDLDVKDVHEWSDEELSLFNDYKLGDFWHYRMKLYREGFIEVKEKPRKKESNINWGFSDSSINSFLNSLPIVLANKAYTVIRNADYHEVYSYVYIESGNSIRTITNYVDEIFTKGTLLNDLFNIKEEGTGKGEALVAFLYPSQIMGISDKFDVLMDCGERNEIKSTNGTSFRFGTKASIGNYKFYENIKEMRTVLRNLVKQLGEGFRESVDQNFYELSMQILEEGIGKRAISTKIDSAEINSEILELIDLWFHMAHVHTHGFDPDKNPIVQNVFNKRYIGDVSLVNVLLSLEYVKEPSRFRSDMDEEMVECFNGIDNLIVFNERDKEINIYDSAEHITIDTISQNGIKVIEKIYAKKKDRDRLRNAFDAWKEDKRLDLYELYVSKRLPLLTE